MLAATSAAFGLPVEGVALVLGIDRILDMGRTATNVVGNSVATVAVARWENALPDEVLKASYAKTYGTLVPEEAEA
jgi:proton glutamate symport protein